jgi:hypothetical protein
MQEDLNMLTMKYIIIIIVLGLALPSPAAADTQLAGGLLLGYSGGPRYAMFTGNFNFIGGNEDFDITSRQWGFGIGLEGDFAMGPRTDFVILGGVEWFADGDLEGHDTVYAPDGETVNGRADYTFDDADAAVNQPQFEFRLMLGIQRQFDG